MKEKKLYLFTLIIFTFFTFVLFWPIFFGKVNLNGHMLNSNFYPVFGRNLPFKNTGQDQLRIYFPTYHVTWEQVRQFKLPLWNPYSFSGQPHVGELQSSVFYPLNFLAFFLGFVEFWHVLRVTPTILASFFTFIYLRNLNVSPVAAVFGAITFGFSPFILTWGEEQVNTPHTIIWLPLVFYSIDRFLKTKNTLFLGIIAFSVAFSVFAGFIQLTMYMLIFALGYLIWRVGPKGVLKSLWFWLVVGAFVIGMAISAMQLVPSAELYFHSARSSVFLKETLYSFLLPPETLFTYLAPDLFGNPTTYNFFRRGSALYYEGIMYVGIAALVFGLFAVFFAKQNKLAKFLTLSGLFALVFTLALPTSKILLWLPIPILSSSIANRLLFIPTFCLAILAAIGMDRWLTRDGKGITKITVFLSSLYLAFFIYLFFVRFYGFPYFGSGTILERNAAGITLRNLIIPFGVFVGTSVLIFLGNIRTRSKKVYAVVITLVALGHIFYFSQKYSSFSNKEYIFPQTPEITFIKNNQGNFRSWGVAEGRLENNFASFWGVFWPEGYKSLNILSYAQFTDAMQGNNLENFIFRSDAGLGSGEAQELLANSGRRKLIDLVGVKYVIAPKVAEDVFKNHNFSKVFELEESKFAVWENKTVLPRAFLASNYEGQLDVLASGESEQKEKEKQRRQLVLSKLQQDDFDYRNVLILEKPSPISAQFGSGSSQIVSYKPDEIIIKTSSGEQKLLFLSDNFYPGWKAKVDGVETEILRADYTFRSVPLIPGEHEVVFYFDSDTFKIGVLISLIGIMSLSLMLLCLIYFQRRLVNILAEDI